VVYLGDEVDGSNAVINLLERVAKTSFKPHSMDGVLRSSLGLPALGAREWVAFRAFWRRPWFKRVWIIQEFLLSQDVTVICGEWERYWEIFFEAAKKTSTFNLSCRSNPYGNGKEHLESQSGAEAMLLLCYSRSKAGCREIFGNRFENLAQPDNSSLKEVESLNVPAFRAIKSTMRQGDTLEAIRHAFGPQPADLRARTFLGMPLIMLTEFSKGSQATDPRDYLFAPKPRE